MVPLVLVIDEQFGQALGQPEDGPCHIQDDGLGGQERGRFLVILLAMMQPRWW